MSQAALFPGAVALRCLGHRAVIVAVTLAVGLGLANHSAQASPLDAVVGVRATIPAHARTADTLGTERVGSGVVIAADGLVLTIGYLILEAGIVEIVLPDGRLVPADFVAYDFATGFGLVRASRPLSVEPMLLGQSDELRERSEVLVASASGPQPVIGAVVVSRRDFAGYWEYLLPDAIFTSPPHGVFGGAALIGRDGRLLGIGSLIVGDAGEPGQPLPGNMFVPIDALKPILDELLATGRTAAPSRPWLGVFSESVRGRVFVTRVTPDGPAAKAGIAKDDVIVAVKGEPVRDVAEFYRKVWALGDAGIDVPLTVLNPRGVVDVTVRSGNRYDYLKLKPSF